MTRLRLAAGWVAVALSAALLCYWAFEFTALLFCHAWSLFFSPWQGFVSAFTLCGLPWAWMLFLVSQAMSAPRRIPSFLLLPAAGGFILLYGLTSGLTVTTVAMAAIGVLLQLGRPEPGRWARRALLGLPVLAALLACLSQLRGLAADKSF